MWIMKRIFVLICALLVLCSLSACDTENVGNSVNNSSDTEVAKAESKYVGVWKANTVSGLIDGEKSYTVSVIELKEDCTGTYKGRKLSWTYSKEQNTINVTLLKENQTAAFEIQEVDDITVLKFFDDIYYRAEDFVPNN